MTSGRGPASEARLIDGLNVREWRPDSESRGVFLMLHGMESHSAWFGEVAVRLAGKGWTVVAYDRAGWGLSEGARGHLGSYRDFVEEAAGVASACRGRHGAVHLAGMSWGGMAALYLGLRRGWLFDSLTLLAPGLATRLDLPFGAKLRAAHGFLRNRPTEPIEPAFRPEHFTHDCRRREFIREDPLRIRRVTASFCIESFKMRRFCLEAAGRRRPPPTLCLLAGDDAIVDNRRVEALCRVAGAGVETLPGSAHTLTFDKPGDVAERMNRHAGSAIRERGGRRGRVWIIGGGAVGGAVGTLLSFAGVSTGMLVKPKYVDKLRADGFTLRSGRAVRTARSPLICADALNEMPPDPDLVILAVKSFDTGAALSALAGKVPSNAILGTLQNGIGNEAKIAAAFPGHTIFAGSVCVGVEMPEAGVVHWPDDRGGFGAAIFRGDAESAREAWLRILPLSGMETRWYDGEHAAERLKWSKLMLNVGFNALNSLTRMSTAELLRDREYGRLAVRALREGFAAMRAAGLKPVDLPGVSVSKMRFAVRLPVDPARMLMAFEAARSAEAPFSMRQDRFHNRQHTEIQDLNGVIVAAGKRFGIRTPVNEKLVEAIENPGIDT